MLWENKAKHNLKESRRRKGNGKRGQWKLVVIGRDGSLYFRDISSLLAGSSLVDQGVVGMINERDKLM